ncbi:hypothetical protein GCM10014713_66600 [Streptomyces purpureus]|uniref:Uncharacterized protein n=1 Tax=Streptomyces purpureus TaxID=1951 RepID=A0A918HI85_9ACTN|nr:hypothetical protein GCM10014713_66600 [Streptomyces purpureus]
MDRCTDLHIPVYANTRPGRRAVALVREPVRRKPFRRRKIDGLIGGMPARNTERCARAQAGSSPGGLGSLRAAHGCAAWDRPSEGWRAGTCSEFLSRRRWGRGAGVFADCLRHGSD